MKRGVRLSGRPQMGWMDGVKRALSERAMYEVRKDDYE